VQGQGGHVLPEHDLISTDSIVKVRSRRVRRMNKIIGATRCHEIPTQIGVFVTQCFDSPVNDLLRHLRASRIVKIDARFAMVHQRQSGELTPNRFNAEGMLHR
jgi:hypothetical protein